MNLPSQNQPRLLPFDRESPGAWQRWEDFWVDFLNADPLLPWPGKPFRFKRSIAAEKWGVAGGSQDGIDMRAEMVDGTVLAVQCKDWKDFDAARVKKAMDKAEREFKQANAYFLVFTAKEISNEIQKEAHRENWKIIGRDTLSSWFFAGKFIDVEAQKQLIERHFGADWLRKLFPQSWDDLLIPLSRFFDPKSLIRHDAQLRGAEFKAMAEGLAGAVGDGAPRISILSAPGGQGKTRLLKATAELVESRYPNRKVRFHNDSAGADAEDYGLRGADFKDLCLFIDDAHRLENVRKRLLRKVQESGSASVLIAARPNNIRALETKLEECGFRESDWQKFDVPNLDHAGRRALAVEILGDDDGHTPDFLAVESERCPLICTVGAELIRSGGVGSDVLKSDDFKRRVFDHLMTSSLDHLFAGDPEFRKTSELCLRVISLLSPINKTDGLAEFVAYVIDRNSIDVDPILSRLEEAGLLRTAREMLRVVPDLLSDHLVYDTAYGEGKNSPLVRKLMETPYHAGLAMIFANLAEAEWRARQEGKKDAFLGQMWEILREILRDPEDRRVYGLLNNWRKIAIFQPERTLELARIILDHESDRVSKGIPEIKHEGYRYDSIAMHLGALPDLLAPVASYHPAHRLDAFDLLWRIGRIKEGSVTPQDDLPAAWQTISKTASLVNWDKKGPQDAFGWLKSWARRQDGKMELEKGKPFLSKVASQWFGDRMNWRWREAEAIRTFPSDIARFQNEVLDWIEMELIPAGLGPIRAALPVIFAAGLIHREADGGQDDQIAAPATKAREMLMRILSLHDDPFLRVSTWQYLSTRVAHEEQEELKAAWLSLRNSIALDLPFQLVRLANSYAIREWNHERMQKWEKGGDYDTGSHWWGELASQTIREIRRRSSSIPESMKLINHANESIVRFRQRASWDMIAEAWSRRFLEERSGVLDELMSNPEHALVSCLGYFLGLRDETDCEFAEVYTLSALAHSDDRVRRAVLHRLSWRDVKRRERIAKRLQEMAASDDPVVVSAVAGFIAWNQYEVTPYLDEVLAALNVGMLSTSELVGVAEAVANLLKYAKHEVNPGLLVSFFRRLEQEEDLNKVFSDHVLSVFHEKFPVELFRVYLTRIRAGKLLPWLLDDWFLSGLPEHLGHPEFENIARGLFHETIHADGDHFHQFGQLFDVSVARVNPRFAAELLKHELRKIPRETQALERIVDLTGAGHGSVVYDAPEFLKELLEVVDLLPTSEANRLRDQLVFGGVPHTWGSTDGNIDEEYLWAKDKARQLAEHYRSDSLLRDFYLSIIKNQEELVAHERQRCEDDD